MLMLNSSSNGLIIGKKASNPQREDSTIQLILARLEKLNFFVFQTSCSGQSWLPDKEFRCL